MAVVSLKLPIWFLLLKIRIVALLNFIMYERSSYDDVLSISIVCDKQSSAQINKFYYVTKFKSTFSVAKILYKSVIWFFRSVFERFVIKLLFASNEVSECNQR